MADLLSSTGQKQGKKTIIFYKYNSKTFIKVTSIKIIRSRNDTKI